MTHLLITAIVLLELSANPMTQTRSPRCCVVPRFLPSLKNTLHHNTFWQSNDKPNSQRISEDHHPELKTEINDIHTLYTLYIRIYICIAGSQGMLMLIVASQCVCIYNGICVVFSLQVIQSYMDCCFVHTNILNHIINQRIKTGCNKKWMSRERFYLYLCGQVRILPESSTQKKTKHMQTLRSVRDRKRQPPNLLYKTLTNWNAYSHKVTYRTNATSLKNRLLHCGSVINMDETTLTVKPPDGAFKSALRFIIWET